MARGAQGGQGGPVLLRGPGTQAFGEAAEERARAWEQVTEALGEVQDTVVAEQTLIRHAATALSAGEPVETYLALESVELRQRERGLWPPDARCWPRP